MFGIHWSLWGGPGSDTGESMTCNDYHVTMSAGDQSPVWPGGSPADNGGGHGESPVHTEQPNTEAHRRGPEEMLEHSPSLVQGGAGKDQASWGERIKLVNRKILRPAILKILES